MSHNASMHILTTRDTIRASTTIPHNAPRDTVTTCVTHGTRSTFQRREDHLDDAGRRSCEQRHVCWDPPSKTCHPQHLDLLQCYEPEALRRAEHAPHPTRHRGDD